MPPACSTGARNWRSRKALPSTKTLDSAMAPAASEGDRSVPLSGWSMAASTGIRLALFLPRDFPP